MAVYLIRRIKKNTPSHTYFRLCVRVFLRMEGVILMIWMLLCILSLTASLNNSRQCLKSYYK